MAKQLEKSNLDYEFIESELRLSEAREENLNDEKEEILQEKKKIIEEKDQEIARLTTAYNDIQQLKAIELAQWDAEFAKMKKIIEEKEEEIANFEVKCEAMGKKDKLILEQQLILTLTFLFLYLYILFCQ